MAMRQGKRGVREYSTEFENFIAKLSSYDESILLNLFIWRLQSHIAEHVSIKFSLVITIAIGYAANIELAIRFAYRPQLKDRSLAEAALSPQEASDRNNGVKDDEIPTGPEEHGLVEDKGEL